MLGMKHANWRWMFIGCWKNFRKLKTMPFATSCDELQFLYPQISLKGPGEWL